VVYKKGLHILSEIYSYEANLLKDYKEVKEFLVQQVQHYKLTQVGEVFHNFEGGGFTGVICLTESHLALHTWPEFGMLTLDIYLSNCTKVNDDKCRLLFEDITKFFKTDRFTNQEVYR
jgi:S-adenosylmethionine decarboxylase